MNRIQKHIAYFLACLILTALPVGCVRQNPVREKLDDANRMTDSMPYSAIAVLDPIDKEGLSEADRNYHDFLTVKADDKAYITHTSDSLILKVLEYYSRHSDDKVYPEALYYGGRVYSDLGDLPTALRYFHSALDLLPPETDNKKLRCNALAQTADILNNLRLNKKSLPYIKEAITIDSIIGDSISLLYDTNFLGTIYLHTKKYDLAESVFKDAKRIASGVRPSEMATQDMYLAAIKYEKGHSDSALHIIRAVLRDIDQYYRHTAISYACKIYYRSLIPDTTIMFARELINDVGFPNRRIGYSVLLSPEMKAYIHPDSAIKYAYDFYNEAESILNKNGDREALIQNTAYNYQIHVREKEKAEEENALLYKWIIGILITISCLVFYIVWLKYKNKSYLLELHNTKNNLMALRQDLDKSKGVNTTTVYDHPNFNMEKISDTERLRSELRTELMDILTDNDNPSAVAPEILESGAYRHLCRYLDQGKILSDTDILWGELEKVVLKSSPDFKRRLNLLTGGSLKHSDFNIALLVKCGLSPTKVSILVGRTKGAISYRRKSLGLRIMGKDLGLDIIDKIIRLL